MPAKRPTHIHEWMDEPDVDRRELARALACIRWVNRRLGGTGAVLGHLRRWSTRWPRTGGPVRILDVATGSADIPAAVLRWARRGGRHVEVIGLDRHPTTLAIARDWTRTTPGLTLVRGDALRLPVADASVDYATCSMFLHHLDDAAALAVLREMLRVSRRGVIVNDLLRSRWAKACIGVLTLFSGSMAHHDGRISVAKGWTSGEARGWAIALQNPWLRWQSHPFARFTLAGERPDASGSSGEWRRLLTPEQYRITREAGTEQAFTGEYWNTKTPGVYRCVCCGMDLFRSQEKFDSDTGWPSFRQPILPAAITELVDCRHEMVRHEVKCSRCGAHLGHVFDDGPPPEHRRYCINSASLKLVPD